MNRRDFLATTTGAVLAAQPASAQRLPIRKGIILGMLPKELSTVQRFELAKECGFQSIESLTIDDPKVAEEIKAASEKTKMPVASVMNKDHWEFPLSSPDPEVVKKSRKGMETSLRNAKLWGSDAVLLVPAVVTKEVSYKQAWDRSHRQIEEMIPMAQDYKVVIAIEEVWNKFLLSPLEFAQYVDSFKSPWVKAYFDVGNMAFYGFAHDWIRTLGSRICKVHFKDFSFRKGVTTWHNLRDGDLDWKAIHAALKDIGYKGDATVEVEGGNAAYLKDLSARVDLILQGA
jgi:hexulose-6-phosphate isomerase